MNYVSVKLCSLIHAHIAYTLYSCFKQCLKSQVNISLLERLYTDKLFNTDTSKWQNLLKLKERKKSNLCEKHYGNHSLLTVSVERFREVVPLFALVCDILIFTFHMGCCMYVCWGKGGGTLAKASPAGQVLKEVCFNHQNSSSYQTKSSGHCRKLSGTKIVDFWR